MERIVNLCRTKRSDQGTRGILFSGDFFCHTIELPWRDNKRGISSIPSGEYNVKIRISPRYGKIYHVKKVPNRTYILMHSGNWAGDKAKGYKSNVAGCILLGLKRGLLANQWAILNSRLAVKRFMKHLEMEPFTLKILENF